MKIIPLLLALVLFTGCKQEKKSVSAIKSKTETVTKKELAITTKTTEKSAVTKQVVTPAMATISPEEFKKVVDTGNVQLIDIRTQREFMQNRIKGAVMFDFYKRTFANDMSSSKLDKSKPIYIYCHTGRRSGIALKQLSAVGFTQVYDLKGGIAQWARKGYPIEK